MTTIERVDGDWVLRHEWDGKLIAMALSNYDLPRERERVEAVWDRRVKEASGQEVPLSFWAEVWRAHG